MRHLPCPRPESANFADLLRFAAEEDPTRTAIRDAGCTVSYAELGTRAGAIAEVLAEGGVRAGDRVAILLERGPAAAAAFFGTLATGAIAVMIHESLRARQISQLLTDSGASRLISRSELLAAQYDRQRPGVPLLDPAAVPDSRDVRVVGRLHGDPALIIYTSGSTGKAKGVTLSHGNLWAGVRSIVAYLGLCADDRVMSLLSLSSVYGLNQLLCSVACRSTLVVERSPLAHQILATMGSEKATVLAAVPPLWLQLLQRPERLTESGRPLRLLQNAGGHLPEAAVRQLRSSLPQADLYLMYGMTEVLRSTYLPPGEVDRRPTSMGRAIPGAAVLVLNENREPCQPGEVGELVHRGPTVALGYWNDPEATARVFRPNPLRTPGTPDAERVVFSGDLVRQDEEGFLYFVGRRDRMIKSMGFRVGPDEIADLLFASGQVLDASIATEPDEVWGTRVIAHVVLRDGYTVEHLAHFCRKELPRHMQPRRIEAHQALPRLPGGKHDLSALTARPLVPPGSTDAAALQAPVPTVSV